MSDKRCSDLLCPVCSIREELFEERVRGKLQGLLIDMADKDEGLLQYRPPTEEQARANWDAMYPPTLRQRIWAKFTTLAQWVRPGRN